MGPMYEKKYTFYFQEISPSPWALEFEADKTYYIISTSDGSKEGLDQMEGGSCVRYNMKTQIRVNSKKEDLYEDETFLPGKDINEYQSHDVTNQFQPTNIDSSINKDKEGNQNVNANKGSSINENSQNIEDGDISFETSPPNNDEVATN